MKKAKRFVVRRFVRYHDLQASIDSGEQESVERFIQTYGKVRDCGYIWFYKQPKHKRSMCYLNWCKKHWFNVLKFYEDDTLAYIATGRIARAEWRKGRDAYLWACNYVQWNMDLVQFVRY